MLPVHLSSLFRFVLFSVIAIIPLIALQLLHSASMVVYENVRLIPVTSVPNAQTWSGVDLVSKKAFRSASTFSTSPAWTPPDYSGSPFYGATVAGPSGTTWALLDEILNGATDVIRLQQPDKNMAGPYSMTGLILFKKNDFPGVSTLDRLTLSPSDHFKGTFVDQTQAGTEEVRWVIQDEGVFYISASSKDLGSSSSPSLISQQPHDLDWFTYDPESSITEIGEAASPAFSNIDFIGFRIEGSAASGGALRIAATKLSFDVSVSNLPPRLNPLPTGQERINEGMLDVTKAPYNADNTGATDAREAIQNAIDDAYATNLVVFFPGGTYRCDGALRCIQTRGTTALSQRKFAHKLVGSTLGPRPVLKLTDGASVDYTHPPGGGAPAPEFPPFLYFSWLDDQDDDGVLEESPSRHYCATLRGIDIDMGNNPKVTAVRMLGAQYCVVEDVHIYGSEFARGIDGLPGSGGSITNLKVTGGRIGVFQNEYRPVPLLTGLELVGQTEFGLKTSILRGPTVVAGFRIVAPDSPGAKYRAVSCASVFVGGGGLNPSVGNLLMVDGTIEVPGSGNTAISNLAQDVFLQNVYVKADTIIDSGAKSPPSDVLNGDEKTWNWVQRYAFRVGSDNGHFVVNGESQGEENSDAFLHKVSSGNQPPNNLMSRHVWPAEFPSWEDSRISIVEFGATPDNPADDDAPYIQQALDAAADTAGPHFGKVVFIPRGHFHVASPISVPSGAKLIGTAQTISILEVARTWAPEAAASVLTTHDSPDAEVTLANFGIVGNEPTIATRTLPDMTAQRSLRYVTVQSGKTWWRNLQTDQRPSNGSGRESSEPLIFFTGNAGGRIYNLCLDDQASSFATNHPTSTYHLLKVDGATQPLQFYAPSTEHLNEPGSSEVSLTSASGIRLFAFKYEGEHRILDATDIRFLQILGGSGNCGQEAGGLFTLNGQCPDVRISCISRTGEDPSAQVWLTDGDTTLADDRGIMLYARDAKRSE